MNGNLPSGMNVLPENDAHAVKVRKNNLYPKAETQSLEELAKAITERGNDMQVTHSKDGLKVFEISKKLVKVIRS